MNREEGLVAVVTGASSGIGREVALAYSRKGARVILASRSRSALETVARECRARGGQVVVAPTDVSDENAVFALAALAVAEYGRIDVWVGNASVFAYGAFEDLPSDIFRQVVETNLFGQVYGARAALPVFRRQGHGTLVVVGSLYSRVSSPTISPYVTSKFGLRGFTDSLRQELRGSGIRLRVVVPATIDTPVYQHAANVTGRYVRPLPPAASPKRVARAIMRAPRRRRFATFVGMTQMSVLPLHSLAPRAYDLVVSWLMNNVELHGRNPIASAGTVFAAPEAAGRVAGGWRSPFGRFLIGAVTIWGVLMLLVFRMKR